MSKPMETISQQGFSEWVCKIVADVYLPYLHSIVGNMLTNKMVSKQHSFLVQGDARIHCVEHHTHFPTNTGVVLDTLIPI